MAFYFCMLFQICFTGDICPAGKFCPAGSPSGQDCPPGTYLDTTGAESEAECIQCTQGSYCAGYGNTAVTAACDAGYYCPAGMNVSNPTEYTCPQGMYRISSVISWSFFSSKTIQRSRWVL